MVEKVVVKAGVRMGRTVPLFIGGVVLVVAKDDGGGGGVGGSGGGNGGRRWRWSGLYVNSSCLQATIFIGLLPSKV